jgi:hypothetical protein
VLPRLALLLALCALVVPATASAASNQKCKAPGGTRAPTRDLHAGFATSCATAKAVARKWDRQCEPSTELCQVRGGGRRWSCRATNLNGTHGVKARYLSFVYVKCGGKETQKGRPAVNFHQEGVIHTCTPPGGPAAPFRFLTAYYDAPCTLATLVAKGWDAACDPAEDHSRCGFDVEGRRWTCEQQGRPGVDPVYRYVCTSPGTGNGRPAVLFGVDVPLQQPPVPGPGPEPEPDPDAG